jgi:hypothetical protein
LGNDVVRWGESGNVERGGAVAEEATGSGGGLWAAADLVTPMAIRVTATLRGG